MSKPYSKATVQAVGERLRSALGVIPLRFPTPYTDPNQQTYTDDLVGQFLNCPVGYLPYGDESHRLVLHKVNLIGLSCGSPYYHTPDRKNGLLRDISGKSLAAGIPEFPYVVLDPKIPEKPEMSEAAEAFTPSNLGTSPMNQMCDYDGMVTVLHPRRIIFYAKTLASMSPTSASERAYTKELAVAVRACAQVTLRHFDSNLRQGLPLEKFREAMNEQLGAIQAIRPNLTGLQMLALASCINEDAPSIRLLWYFKRIMYDWLRMAEIIADVVLENLSKDDAAAE